MKKIAAIILPVLVAIPTYAAESQNPPDGHLPGFKAGIIIDGGTFPSAGRPYYGLGAFFGYALSKTPLEFSAALSGGNTGGTISFALTAKMLGKWPLGRVSPIASISGGWAFQLPSTHEVSVSSDPEFGWMRTYIPSSARTMFSEDGPFGEVSAGASVIAGSSYEICITVGYSLSACYEGVWGRSTEGKAVRYGLLEKFENYPGLGSRYVWTEGRRPMKPLGRLRIQISFSF
ncbi:MAG: hypothetical protein IKR69_05245 [Bacteroidales bacterium]|nr:hypothetical protein [Bacteroidales bacterium]